MNVNFYTILGSRIQKSDVHDADFLTEARRQFHVVEVQNFLYISILTRAITLATNGTLQNDAPVVIYLDQHDQGRHELKKFLEPRGLWYDGQFGVWSFAVKEER